MPGLSDLTRFGNPGPVALGGLAAASAVLAASLVPLTIIGDPTFMMAGACLGALGLFGILRGVGWACVPSSIGYACLGLVAANGRPQLQALTVTVGYALVALVLLSATHLSFLGRRDTTFSPGVVRSYLATTIVAAATGFLLSGVIYLIAQAATWQAWLFPATILATAATIGFWGWQIGRHRSSIGPAGGRF